MKELTERQKQVLQALVDGLTKSQIAVRLGISIKTVAKHHHNLLVKYRVETRAQLIAQAVARGDVAVDILADEDISVKEEIRHITPALRQA